MESLAIIDTVYVVPGVRPWTLSEDDLEFKVMGLPPPTGTSVKLYKSTPVTGVPVSTASCGPRGSV